MKRFSSQVPKCIVIDDSLTDADLRTLAGDERRGYRPRDYTADPLGSHECAKAGEIERIPTKNWPDLIREKQEKKQRGIDLMNLHKIPPMHQGKTNSCWANDVIDNGHFVMAAAGGPVIRLSSASVAGPVKRFRNKGGNCSEALKQMADVGVCSADVYPENANTNSRLWTAEAKANAALHRVLEWDDLDPGDFEQMGSLLLQPRPRVVAFCNWSMRHAVLAIDLLVNARGQFSVLCRNSGAYRDKNGMTVFSGRRAVPNDACSIRTMLMNARVA